MAFYNSYFWPTCFISTQSRAKLILHHWGYSVKPPSSWADLNTQCWQHGIPLPLIKSETFPSFLENLHISKQKKALFSECIWKLQIIIRLLLIFFPEISFPILWQVLPQLRHQEWATTYKWKWERPGAAQACPAWVQWPGPWECPVHRWRPGTEGPGGAERGPWRARLQAGRSREVGVARAAGSFMMKDFETLPCPL